MPEILVRGLDQKTVRSLEERARISGRSLPQEVKDILERAATTLTMEEARRVSVQWRGLENRPVGAAIITGRGATDLPLLGERRHRGEREMTETPRVRRVTVALFDGFTVLDVYGPVQAFASCRVGRPDGTWERFFEVVTMAATAGPVKAGEGPATVAEHRFEDAPPSDILVIPGGFGTRTAVKDDAWLARLAAASARAAITTTVCTGSALLARTGLLDDRPATSNKIAWDWVVAQGPRVRWQRKARWVDDGTILTSSGVSAGIDMTLALIARLNGRDLALVAARNMEYVWREDPGDDPFA